MLGNDTDAGYSHPNNADAQPFAPGAKDSCAASSDNYVNNTGQGGAQNRGQGKDNEGPEMQQQPKDSAVSDQTYWTALKSEWEWSNPYLASSESLVKHLSNNRRRLQRAKKQKKPG